MAPPGDPAPTVTAEDVDAALEQIPDQAEAILETSGVPGMSVVVVYKDEVVYAEGFGVKELGTDDAVDGDTVFPLASLSKPLSATVVAGLVGDGLVQWDDPVASHLDGFGLSEPYVSENVTIADMFSHRSGLPAHAGDLLEDMGYNREQIIERLEMLPLTPFRDSYAYTNIGLTAGAVSAANAAGMTWEDASEKVLFEPAGMSHTSMTYAGLMAEGNRALPHRRDANGNFELSEQRQPDPQAPAGGASSSARDMGQWLRIQLNDGSLGGKQVIDPKALAPMRTPQSVSGPPGTPSAHAGFYGLGLGIGYRDDGYTSWSHSGAFLMGTGTAVNLVPGQNLGVAVLTNGAPVGAAEAMAATVVDLVVDGEVTRDWWAGYSPQFEGFYEPETPTDWAEVPSDPTPPRELSTYVGTYSNDYYGPMTVREDDGALVMTLGPAGMEFPLDPYDGDAFLFTPPGENSLGPTGITFTVEGAGVTSVNSEFYDTNGLGTWVAAG